MGDAKPARGEGTTLKIRVFCPNGVSELRVRLSDVKPGRYQLGSALADTTRENAVTGLQRTPDGWFVRGEMAVEGK